MVVGVFGQAVCCFRGESGKTWDTRGMMDPDTRGMVRWTMVSALGLGLLFVVVALIRASGAGMRLEAVAAPITAFGIVGLTVGGLIGPLLRGVWLNKVLTSWLRHRS